LPISCITSNIEDLPILATNAAEAVPKVMLGKINSFIPCKLKIEADNPPTGNHDKFTEKPRINIAPNQKFGMETHMSANVVLEKSNQVFCLIAEMMPATTPIIVATIMLTNDNLNVFGNLLIIAFVTGSSVW